jgi:hypothetical protein
VHVHETRISGGDEASEHDEPANGAGDEDGTSDRARGVAWVTRQELRDFGVSSMTKKALADGAA